MNDYMDAMERCPKCNGERWTGQRHVCKTQSHRSAKLSKACAMSESPKPETMDLRALIIDAMRDAWNDICSDTNCHPDDISHEGRRLFFEPGHWASQTADIVASKIEAVSAALSAKPETDFETQRPAYEAAVNVLMHDYALHVSAGDRERVIPKQQALLGCLSLFWRSAWQAAHTALLARLAEVERERDRLGENGYVITTALAEAQRELVKETQRADENYADFTAEQKLRTTAEAALATAQGQLAEADAAITSLHYPNHNEKHWLDAIARHKARAAGKGTE